MGYNRRKVNSPGKKTLGGAMQSWWCRCECGLYCLRSSKSIKKADPKAKCAWCEKKEYLKGIRHHQIDIEYHDCVCGGRIKKIGSVWQCNQYWENSGPHDIKPETGKVETITLTKEEMRNLRAQFGMQTDRIISEAQGRR